MIGQIKIAMVDDHVLLRTALAALINSFQNCRVLYEADDGAELISKIQNNVLPDIVLLDLNMPVMDGFETAVWLRSHAPKTQVLMLTMYDSELILIKLLQAGVKGFLKKDIAPSELYHAIKSVMESGYYYSPQTAGQLASLHRNSSRQNPQNALLTEQETQFLKLACSELTYKEIAESMGMRPRTIDTLRDQLFLKLDVKSRVGLVMVAIRNGLVRLSN